MIVETIKSNRRKTSRLDLNIPGELHIKVNGKVLAELIEISNISYDGMQVVFANNDFLLDFLKCFENEECSISTSFKYNEKDYILTHKILWIRLYNVGEKNFYVLTGILFRDRAEIDEQIIEILLSLHLKNVYLG